MPLPYRETTKDGKPRFEVLIGFDRRGSGEPLWAGVGITTARELLNNENAFKEWVAKHTRSKNDRG